MGALASQAGMHRAMQGYFCGITGVDLELRLLETLDDIGQAQDTIVIYTSDHGEMIGSQGRMAKQVPFEESCRVPFSVRYPGVTAAGGSSKALIAAIDIYPTVCGLAGIAIPKHCAGQDMSDVMRGRTAAASHADIVFLMCDGPDAQIDGDDLEEGDEHAASRLNKSPAYRAAEQRRTPKPLTQSDDGSFSTMSPIHIK